MKPLARISILARLEPTAFFRLLFVDRNFCLDEKQTFLRSDGICFAPDNSDEHWNCFKGNVGETSERRGGVHNSGIFSERIDTILN